MTSSDHRELLHVILWWCLVIVVITSDINKVIEKEARMTSVYFASILDSLHVLEFWRPDDQKKKSM